MQPKDVRECAQIIATHPVIGPRYGGAIKDLHSAWLRLLGREAMTTAVFEETNGARATIVGVGVGVFVRDDFVRELKTSPQFWFGRELTERTITGNSPVLTDREVREANSDEGLNELVWETLTWPQFSGRTEIYHLMGSAYIEIHRGFRLREMITAQAESAERLQWAVDAGGLYWDAVRGRYTKSLPGRAEEFFTRPHIVGITRELELARPGSWVGVLFDYHPPRLGFSRSEQELLLVALRCGGGTDRELATALHLTVPTVKKLWVSIYHRATLGEPVILSDRGPAETGHTVRGRGKKHRLLAYIRLHPEELRPVSRRRINAGRPTSGCSLDSGY